MSKEVPLPPVWCANICAHSMSEVCIEDCAIRREAVWFKLKEGINLDDLPPFPLQEFIDGELTPKERQVCVAVYVAKLVDQAKGIEDERQPAYYKRSSRLFAALQSASLRPDPEKGNPGNQGIGAENSDRGDAT